MPADAEENQIADALIVQLKRINADREPDKWLTSPKTISRGFVISGLGLPRPVLLVQVSTWEDNPLTGGLHDSDLQVAVHMLVEQSRADEELCRLKRDVIVAVALDETLDGTCTYCFPMNYTPQIEAMEKAGLGVATLIFRTRYTWTHAIS